MTIPLDAVVVGSGPNGLAAAIVLAEAGRSVRVLEGAETIGGGTRTAELTEPGVRHDVCSAAHPLAIASPLLARLPLAAHGLELVQPAVPLVHVLDGGEAVVMDRSVEATADGLAVDAEAYVELMAPLVDRSDELMADILGPIRVPRHPLVTARFGAAALRSATGLATSRFVGRRARALFAGCAAHSMAALEQPGTAAFGLVLAILGHAAGWPVVRGGSEAISIAMASYLRSLGGEIETGRTVASLGQLPPARQVLWDTTPAQFLSIAGSRLNPAGRRTLQRFRRGPGVFKLDCSLDGPIPWTAPEAHRAGTVHIGGTLDEVAASERAVASGRPPERPYVLVVQPAAFDPTRAPEGIHTLWAYCHVPNGSRDDMTATIEAQLERFAPGYAERVRSRSTMGTSELEAYNPNYLGGDINAGAADLAQVLTRPRPVFDPYRLPLAGHLICSASTPPGGGVHGMCGYWAARSALRSG